jgi:hypothetical protein
MQSDETSRAPIALAAASRGDVMKLVFYKLLQTGNGKPVAQPVLTVEDLQAREASPGAAGSPAIIRGRLAHWRQFADFFEIC